MQGLTIGPLMAIKRYLELVQPLRRRRLGQNIPYRPAVFPIQLQWGGMSASERWLEPGEILVRSMLIVSRPSADSSSLPHPGAIMDSVYWKKSCDPFSGPEGTCSQGVYPEYAVNVTSPEDVIKTLGFVKKHNVRLVVKNTGHEYVHLLLISVMISFMVVCLVIWGGRPARVLCLSGRTINKSSIGSTTTRTHGQAIKAPLQKHMPVFLAQI